jgi:Mor family transcriptional regulator
MKKTYKIRAARNKAIVSDWIKGATLEALGLKYGNLTKEWIRQIVDDSGAIREITPATIKREKFEKSILEDLYNGMLPDELAEKYHLAKSTITTILRAFGVNGVVDEQERKKKYAKIVKIYQSGKDGPTTASLCGVSKMTVSRVLKSAGIKTRRGGGRTAVSAGSSS